MMLKKVPIRAKNKRPIIWPRTWRSPRRCDSARKRSMLASCWPNVLLSRIPETESDSSVIALISAIDCWVRVLTWRLTFPTRKGQTPSQHPHPAVDGRDERDHRRVALGLGDPAEQDVRPAGGEHRALPRRVAAPRRPPG